MLQLGKRRPLFLNGSAALFLGHATMQALQVKKSLRVSMESILWEHTQAQTPWMTALQPCECLSGAGGQ